MFDRFNQSVLRDPEPAPGGGGEPSGEPAKPSGEPAKPEGQEAKTPEGEKPPESEPSESGASAPTSSREEHYRKLYREPEPERREPSELEQKIDRLLSQSERSGAAPSGMNASEAASFEEALQNGDLKGAKDLLRKEILGEVKGSQDKLAQSLGPVMEQAMNAQFEIRDFNRKTLDEHSELREFEREIARDAKDLVDLAQNRGSIKSVDDYIDAYKAAVRETVDRWKSRVSKLRGEGAENATRRVKEVVNGTPVAPGSSAAPEPGGEELPMDSEGMTRRAIERRQQLLNLRNRGLTARLPEDALKGQT